VKDLRSKRFAQVGIERKGMTGRCKREAEGAKYDSEGQVPNNVRRVALVRRPQ